MVDRSGTFIGFMVGSGPILFGVAWPDRPLHAHAYRTTQSDAQTSRLAQPGVPRAQPESLASAEKEISGPREAGAARFAHLEPFLIVLWSASAATLIPNALGGGAPREARRQNRREGMPLTDASTRIERIAPRSR